MIMITTIRILHDVNYDLFEAPSYYFHPALIPLVSASRKKEFVDALNKIFHTQRSQVLQKAEAVTQVRSSICPAVDFSSIILLELYCYFPYYSTIIF
jgi:hypothetical protein